MTANAAAYDEEIVIDLADLVRHLWQRKKLIIVSTLLGALILAAVSLSMRNVYETQILLAPAQSDAGALSQLAGQFGGLASLAGIDIGGNDQLIVEGIATFTARDFLLDFIHDYKLKPVLFYKDWDSHESKWEPPNLIARGVKQLRNALLGSDETPRYADPNEPTDWDTYALFTDDFISVKQDKKTSLVTVSVRAYTPQDSVTWATELVHRVNEHLRQTKKLEAEKSIAYLEKASQQTSVVEMQSAIYQLIEAQTKTIMLANINDEFAFKTVDPAFYPEEKAKPKRSLMTIGGGFLGFAIAFVFVFAQYLRQLRHEH